MNCIEFETWVALYVEGDLPHREARAVEAHLRACPACRDLAAALAESQAVVKSLQGEPVDPGVLEQVRRRVLDRVTARPRPAWEWSWKFALAGFAIVIGAVVLWRSHSASPPIPEVSKAPVVIGTTDQPAPARAQAAPPRRRRRTIQRPKIEAATVQAEPLLVKLVTEDPDIVIIWIVDRNGG